MLYLCEGGPFRLCFDDAGGLPVEKEQVVNPPVALLQTKLANGNSRAGTDIGVVGLLYKPACEYELPINLDPSTCLTREVVMIGGSHGAEDTGRVRR